MTRLRRASAIVTLSLLISAATAGGASSTRRSATTSPSAASASANSPWAWLTEPDVLEALAKRRREITGWRRW